VGLTQTRIGIPSKVDLAEREKTDESARTAFQRDWEKELDDQPWDRCEKARFLRLARWLDTRCHEDVGELLKEMEALGEPDEPLIECIGGKKEYGDRGIANPLTKEEGFGLVKKLLEQLQEKNEAHRPLGVRMLADRLAEAAGVKEGER
jgi:hypothetical protein